MSLPMPIKYDERMTHWCDPGNLTRQNFSPAAKFFQPFISTAVLFEVAQPATLVNPVLPIDHGVFILKNARLDIPIVFVYNSSKYVAS